MSTEATISKKPFLHRVKRFLYVNIPFIPRLVEQIRYSFQVIFIGNWYKIRYASDRSKIKLSNVQTKILNELKQNGISMIHYSELFPNDDYLGLIEGEMNEFFNQEDVKEKIRNYQLGILDKRNSKQFVAKKAVFQEFKWVNDATLKMGLSMDILDIANAYLETYSRIGLTDLWYNMAAKDGEEAKYSQKWHRDYEDKKLVKVFMYLNDVTELNGPFSYIPKSHSEGKFGKRWQIRQGFFRTGSIYPEDKEFEELFGDKSISCTGRKGTIIFCDTNGFHKGGYCQQDRLLAHWMYLRPSSTNGGLMNFDSVDTKVLNTAQLIALEKN